MTQDRRRGLTSASIPMDLPGADLVVAGIDALQRGKFTKEALLVAVGAPRLRCVGLDIPHAPGWPREPELALYAALCSEAEDDAHSRYNALIRRLVSFERAAEAVLPKKVTT